MEAGQLAIERAGLSAGVLLLEAVDMQKPLAASADLELQVEVDPDVPEVWGDRDRLLQVFENLIGNAIKFTPAGGRITAAATSEDEAVVFRVADTGVGIASRTCPASSTSSGRQPGLDGWALASDLLSPRASSKPTAVAFGSRAQKDAAVLFPSRFPKPPQHLTASSMAYRRIVRHKLRCKPDLGESPFGD